MNPQLRIINVSAWTLRAKFAFGLLSAALIEVALVAVSLALIGQNLPLSIRAEVGNQITLSLLVVLLTGLTLLGLAWALLNVYVLAPLERLREGLKQLAQGGYDRPLPVPPVPDEIGQATNQLNVINEQFQQSINALQATVADRTRDLEAASQIGLTLSTIRDSQTLADRGTALITERFADVAVAQFFLLDDSGTHAILKAATGEQGRKLIERGYQVSVDDPGPIGQVVRNSASLIVADVKQISMAETDLAWSDMQVECILPIRIGSTVFGVLDLYSRNADTFTNVEMRVFQTIADQFSSTIQNAQLFEELHMRLSEFEALNRQTIARAWRDYSMGLRSNNLLANLSAGEGALTPLQRQAIETGKYAEQRDSDHVRFAVPIHLRGQPLGAVEWEVPRATYNETLRALAEELTARLALTADNIRLLEQSQRQAQRERMLNDIGGALTQQTDIAQILETAVQQLGQALNVSQTVIELRKEISG